MGADRLNLVAMPTTPLVKPADVRRSWQTCSTRNGAPYRHGVDQRGVVRALVESMGEKSGLDLFRRLGDNGVAVRTRTHHSAVLVQPERFL